MKGVRERDEERGIEKEFPHFLSLSHPHECGKGVCEREIR